MTGRTRLRRWSTGSAALLMAAALAACGSDDGGGGDGSAAETSATETDATETDATETGATEAGASGGDPEEFCEAAVSLEAGFASGGPGPDESAPPEEQQAALAEFSAMMEPLLAEVEETAPEEISGDVETATGLVREGLAGNDPSVLEGPEFQEADDNIDEYMLAECGYEQIEATGVDHEYEGIPDTVPAGVVALTFTNEGDEVHEIGIARINDDVTEPVEQLLTLPEEEVFSKLQLMGVTYASPGESETTFLRLDEGRYGAACFIPEGTTHIESTGSGPRTSPSACSPSSPPSDRPDRCPRPDASSWG